MIKFNIIIKYYMLSFLLIDSISGFVRIYLGITNPIFNIGYWVRGPILFIFIFYYFSKIRKQDLFYDEFLSLLMFMFFIASTFSHFVSHSSFSMLIEDTTYILRFQFLLFLFVYIKNRFKLTTGFSKKVIVVNFSVFVPVAHIL